MSQAIIGHAIISHWIIAPILLPAMSAAILVLLGSNLALQRVLNLVATVALVAVNVGLVISAADGNFGVYALSDWSAPFGIVLVLDRLSALMLLLTSAVALASLLYALRGADSSGKYFHALFQFLLMGLGGAFLTGDFFNLFVFFEVLLIASYGLLLHGRGGPRLKAGFHYVAINLTGSALFLIGVTLLYAMTGTLNMADMALKVAAAPAEDAALIRAGALIMLVVFSIKAALLPLNFWLPDAYSVVKAPVAALFAIMTKVGAYAVIRIFTLIFGSAAGIAADVAMPWLLPVGLATMVIATVGALASNTMRVLVSYLTITSVGAIFVGIGLFTPAALSAAIYYLVHSTITIALLFLLADLIGRNRGEAGDKLTRNYPVAQPALLGWLFLAGAAAVVGAPPLSGFLGKVMLLQGSQGHAAAVWVWAAVLGSALLMLVAMARAGSMLFWHVDSSSDTVRVDATLHANRIDLLAMAVLIGCIVVLTIWAGPVARYTTAAANDLLQPAAYIRGVLGESPALDAFGRASPEIIQRGGQGS
jgi:multicomponent K+:H+ antiporter subunit D